MDEEWRDIPGFEGSYQVSNLGRVRSLDRLVTVKYVGRTDLRRRRGVLLEPHWNEHGYATYSLYYGQKERRVVQAQHVVLEAFVGPRPVDKPQIRHLDGNPANNRVDNLVYATVEENVADKFVHGTDHYAFRDHCDYGHPYAGDNLRVKAGWTKNAVQTRVCRSCAAASSALHRFGYGGRGDNPELFQVLGDYYLAVLQAGEPIRGCLPPVKFAELAAQTGARPVAA